MINITKVNYKISDTFKITNLDLNLDKGTYHLLGPNGAGKTSFLNLLSGLCSPDTGHIFIGNVAVNPLNLGQLSKVRAYLMQKQVAHFALTVKGMLAITLSLSESAVETLCENHDVIKGLDLLQLLNRSITALSGGESQRAHLARVLLHCDLKLEPNFCLLLLDEPYTGLDVSHKLWLNQYLTQLGKYITVLISHHELNLALNLAQPCIIINNGQIHRVLTDSRDIEKSTLVDVFKLPLSVLSETNEGILQIIGI
ncbi:ATP-binding cassette domain-containing protein [Pseudoalteromonas denitrificans]|jgi:ABC-type cobalamin/Fe3+-siderophores transport system ATPase subunit|uniref:Vitamin B12 transport system ATP-binding protein n=1 Tax=Pseudoalteromonas denitrificans DSM 6059 TaxID=1123010 RepID=A0A1I1GNQ6_9GAMM|nr:ATP-binding cassette domain-containing protein [Pseudoalteromonas denitrificans]SFC13389.1 vitamin B12 transport system ATP-binding protein [Pseudoalteromonas denitrificans DSM 6059]